MCFIRTVARYGLSQVSPAAAGISSMVFCLEKRRRSNLKMPVLESTDNLTPRSALRHRPIGDDAIRQGPIVSTGATPVVQRASRLRPKQTDGEEEIKEWQRADTGTTKQGRTTAAPRQAGKAAKNLPKMPRQKAVRSKGKFWRGAHPLLYLGIGMLAMLALWTVLSMAVSWGSTTWNDLHYGRPRTFQIDALVEHNDSSSNPSHFIALGLLDESLCSTRASIWNVRERASLASLCPDTTGGALPARTSPCSLLPSAEAFWEGSLLLYRLAGGRQSYGPAWLYRYLRVAIP